MARRASGRDTGDQKQSRKARMFESTKRKRSAKPSTNQLAPASWPSTLPGKTRGHRLSFTHRDDSHGSPQPLTCLRPLPNTIVQVSPFKLEISVNRRIFVSAMGLLMLAPSVEAQQAKTF